MWLQRKKMKLNDGTTIQDPINAQATTSSTIRTDI
jgi:hypothetical protein